MVNNFSLGLVMTRAGRLDGLAVAPAGNWINREVRGAQIAAGFNVAGGEVTGPKITAV